MKTPKRSVVNYSNRSNRRGFSADGRSLLPSALRPRLLWAKINETKVSSAPKSTFISSVRLVTIVSLLLGVVVNCNSTSAASLTLTIPDSLSLSISPESTSTFKESSPVNLVVKTDAYSGYTLNIKSKDNTNTLKNSSVSGSVLNSITSEMSAATFQSSGTNNTWGFKSSKYKGSSNDNYQPGPTSDVLLEKTSGADNTSGVTYNLGIAAKVDGSLAYGTYKNTFTITATANPVPYTFSYNSNGGSSTPSTQSGTGNEGSTKNLTTSTPSKSGYTFQGWCTVNPGTSESCSGAKYSSGAAYTLTNSSNSVTFYAIWKATSTGIQCGDARIILTDCSASGYSGKRVNGGKCWMWEDYRNNIYYSQLSSNTCPSGWHMPSMAEFEELSSSSQAGNGSCLYDQGWGRYSMHYWTSTPINGNCYKNFNIQMSSTSSGYTGPCASNGPLNIRCVAP